MSDWAEADPLITTYPRKKRETLIIERSGDSLEQPVMRCPYLAHSNETYCSEVE